MQPLSCDTFVALPPSSAGQRIVFGKNSDRPCDEVQEVVYYPAQDHQPGEKLECTYVWVEQVSHTHAVVLSRPAWLWGAEMGANEHQVCIGNEAVWGRESVEREEALLGMDLVRLALERAETAEGAVKVITQLLERHGQGGNCQEDPSGFTYHNSFLICDRAHAWVLETAGKYWAAERVTAGGRNLSNQYSITTRLDKHHAELQSYARGRGWWDGRSQFSFTHAFSSSSTPRLQAASDRFSEGRRLLEQHRDISAENMMEILRDKESGINMQGQFMTTGSMISVLPSDPSLPAVHYFTATPDPARSVFKPFVFVSDVRRCSLTCSPCFGASDPVKTLPRFQTKPDRRHPLFLKHEEAVGVMAAGEEQGRVLLRRARELEARLMAEMEAVLGGEMEDHTRLVHLFTDAVEEELSIYSQ